MKDTNVVLEARKQLLVGLGMIDREAIRMPDGSMIIPYYTLENMTGDEWSKLFCEIDDMDLSTSERNRSANFGYELGAIERSELIALIKECEEYLSDNHQQGGKSAIAVNTISTGSILHNKMKSILNQSTSKTDGSK